MTASNQSAMDVLIAKYTDKIDTITENQRTDDAIPPAAAALICGLLEGVIEDLKLFGTDLQRYVPSTRVSYGGGIFDGDEYHDPIMAKLSDGGYVRYDEVVSKK